MASLANPGAVAPQNPTEAPESPKWSAWFQPLNNVSQWYLVGGDICIPMPAHHAKMLADTLNEYEAVKKALAELSETADALDESVKADLDWALPSTGVALRSCAKRTAIQIRDLAKRIQEPGGHQ